MRKPLGRLFMPQADEGDSGVLPFFPSSHARKAEASGPAASPSAGSASASHRAIDGPLGGRHVQIQDNDRADAPGSKSRHPAPRASGSTDRRRAAQTDEDALVGSAPQTDDTPTIISRNSPAGVTAQPPDPDGIRGRRLAHFELLEPIGVGGMAAVLR